MRSTLIAAILIVFGAASACAQKNDEPALAGPMPLLRAADMIELCMTTHQTRSARLQHCSGAFTEACIARRAGGDTTIGMVQCAREERDVWDAILNETYTELREAYRGMSARRTLRDAQRVWVEHRDADCAYQASLYEGGSLAQNVHIGCLSGMTAERALTLIEWREFNPPY